MSEKPDGGPAFPLAGSKFDTQQNGMSLRQWYAGQALTAATLYEDSAAYPIEIAKKCFALADAMLAEEGK